MNMDARRAADKYDGAVMQPAPPAPSRIEKRGSTGPAPLSFAQERLWFLEQFQPGGATYNIPMAIDLAGDIDIDALSRSLNDLVARHETLRTTFANIAGRPVQVIAPRLDLPLPVVECAGATDLERREHAQQIAGAEARRPFDLVRGPLIRATLIALNPQRWLLLIVLHHAVADAWSIAILSRELGAFYEAHCTGSRRRPAAIVHSICRLRRLAALLAAE